MNDFELNKAIAEALGLRIKGKSYTSDGLFVFIDGEGSVGTYLIDFVNSWDDLIPLVVEHGLLESATIMREVSLSDNIQRALAEALLKVLESNNV